MGQGMSNKKPFKPHWHFAGKDMLIGGGLMIAVMLGVWLFWPKGGDDLPGVIYKPVYVEAAEMLHLAQVLSSDALEGRAAGTAGNEAARGFIHKRFEEIGLLPLPGFGGYTHTFPIVPREAEAAPIVGANLIGYIPGKTPGVGPALLVTAHYDHLGVREGEIYNGADDNASGASALVAVAEYFALHRPEHDMVIAALDAEEIGLLGARALARMDGFDMGRVALNMNFDMVGRSEASELYVAGTYHTPELAGMISEIADDLDAPRGALGRLGMGGAEGGDVHAVVVDASGSEVLLDGEGALGAESLVGLPSGLADGVGVGVSFDADGVGGIAGVDDLRDLVEGAAGGLLDCGLAGVEEDVADDVEDGSAAGEGGGAHAGDAFEAGGAGAAAAAGA